MEAMLEIDNTWFQPSIQIFLPRLSTKPGKQQWDSQVSLWQLIPTEVTY